MKRSKSHKILSLIMSFVIVFSIIPTNVYASTENVEVDTTEINEDSGTTDSGNTLTEVSEETSETDTGVTEEVVTDDSELWGYSVLEEGVSVELTKYYGDATDVYVPGTITVSGVEYTVVKLGDSVFANNDALNSATLANSITAIGTNTFNDCDNMVCVLVGEQFTTIGENAFASCDAFNSIILYDAVNDIAVSAFSECANVTIWCNEGSYAQTYAINNSITYKLLDAEATPETVKLGGVEYYIMNGEAIAIGFDQSTTVLDIPEAVNGYPVTKINANSFENCNALTKVTLPETLKEIGDYAFRSCVSIQEINIPENVTKLGKWCFDLLEKLTKIKLPSGITVLDVGIFSGCKSLSSVEIQYGVTSIENSAFAYCKKLNEIIIPDSVTYIGISAFRESGIDYITLSKNLKTIGANAFLKCYGLKEFIIPEGVESLGGGLFWDDYDLEKLVVPNSVSDFYGTTNYDAFAHMSRNSLKELVIGNSLASQIHSFISFPNLEKLTLLDGVTEVDSKAFCDTYKLPYVVIPETVDTLYKDSFANNTVLVVHRDSYAHKFAEENGLLYLIYEDGYESNIVKYDGVTYCVLEDKAIGVCFDGSETSVTVPSEINGKPVKELRQTFCNQYNITEVILPDGLETISDKTFYNCQKLNSIVIPDSVTSIGKNAFYYCYSMTSVALSNNLTKIDDYTFYDCSKLTEINIPNSVTSIGNYAFGDCTSLTNASLPANITAISDYMFYNCQKLLNVNIPAKVATIGTYGFAKCSALEEVSIPEGVASIGAHAFYDCDSLEEIVMPDTITSIGDFAFHNMESITSIKISKGITEIGVDVFSWNFKLDNVVIPDGVTKIGSCSFFNCKSLKNITIPSSVKVIANKAFTECAFTDLVLPEGLERIETRAFENCYSLKNVLIPDSVNYIGTYAFSGCNVLENVSLSNSIQSINAYIFNGCSKLKEIEIPDSVTRIYDHAFKNCDSLTTLTLPTNIGQVDAYSFESCDSLKNVNVLSENITIKANTFYNTSLIEIVTSDKTVNTGYNISTLEKVTLNEGVETIESQAFRSATKLQTVIIPKSVSSMAVDSFADNVVLLVWEDSYAHQFAEENDLLYFVYDGGDVPGIVVIDGITYCVFEDRAIAIHFDESSTTVTMPSTVEGVPVTEIRATFKDCAELISVTLPDSLVRIGDYAFKGCIAITEITVPDSVLEISDEVFMNCSELTTVSLSNNLDTIGNSVFKGCGKLDGVILPESLTSIGTSAFYECVSLSEITIPSGVSVVEKETFYKCSNLVNISLENIVTINEYAFYECQLLENAVLSDKLEKIGQYAFYNCTALNDVTFGTSITEISNYAFYNCDSLTNIVSDSTIDVIGSYAFNDCDSLSNVAIKGVNTLGTYTFNGCDSLKSIKIEESLEATSWHSFSGCSSLTEVILPECLKEIGESSFRTCYSLKSIDIPDSVEIIGNYAFSNCSGLIEVIVPESVTDIRTNAFSGCTSLVSAYIPSTVKVLGNGVFSGCSILENVSLNEGLETINGNAFANCPKLRFFYIPDTVTTMDVSAFTSSTILLVHENSNAHVFAETNDLLYFVLGRVSNPEIAYGTSISGKVKYVNGSIPTDAKVYLLYDDGSVKEEVTVNDEGTYEFTYAEVGRYTIKVVDSDGKVASTLISIKRMNVFSVFLAGDTNLTLKQGWTVSGSVSKYPADIYLTDENGNVIADTESTDGTFSFSEVPNGTYILKGETSESSIAQEITVYNGDVKDVVINIPENIDTASIWGYVEVEGRDKNHHRRNWVQVTLYDSEGIALAHCKSDEDGKYEFTKLPLGEYTIVAETAEMRPDHRHHYKFDRNYMLTGYAYVNVEEAKAYEVETIVLYEENDNSANISGKVTSLGEPQISEVILKDVFRHEVAKCITGNNGKYTFKNIKDGMYFIVAKTESDGMGFALVTVRNGKVFGNTNIIIFKSDKIKEYENKFRNEVPDCQNRDEALEHKERIAKEKHHYDGLSEKEKQQLSKEYVDRLNKYSEWLAEVDVSYESEEEVVLENSGLILTEDEINDEKSISFNLKVEKKEEHAVSTDGVHSREDHIHHSMKDAAGKREIKQYYDISLTKTVDDVEQEITNIQKDTDSTGKLRITLTIPEEHRGYKSYNIIHEHCGDIVTLADLDDNPDTITFEVDRFSTFALAATNDSYVQEKPTVELKFAGASITLYDNLTINYKVNTKLFTENGFENPYVIFTLNGISTKVNKYIEEDGYYVFDFNEIAPNQLNDTIEAVLYAEYDGEIYSSAVKEYSVGTYCYNMLEKYGTDDYSEFRTLLVDLLNFGAESQEYTEYNVSNLVNADLTETQSAWGTSVNRDFISVKNLEHEIINDPTVIWGGAGLNLTDSVEMRFEITTSDIDNLCVKVTDGSDGEWIISSDEFKSDDGNVYYFYFDGYNAGQMSDAVYLTVYKDEIAVSNTLSYSIESYAESMLSNADENLNALLLAMMKYGDSAKKFNSMTE